MCGGERGGIASQLWVVGCNPLFETRFSGCFPACKARNAPNSLGNREKRAVRPLFLGFTRIFSILLPPGMLVAAINSGFAWYNAVSCAFPYLLRRCMPALPIYTPFSIRTSGFILDPPTIPDRCAAGERGGIASQLWVVGCNPLLDPWILFRG